MTAEVKRLNADIKGMSGKPEKLQKKERVQQNHRGKGGPSGKE